MHLFTVLEEWDSTMQTLIDVETLLVSENKTLQRYDGKSCH